MKNEDWLKIIAKEEDSAGVYADWLEDKYGNQHRDVVTVRTWIKNNWWPGNCLNHPHKPAWIWERGGYKGDTGYGMWWEDNHKNMKPRHVLPIILFDRIEFLDEEVPYRNRRPSSVIGFKEKHVAIKRLIFALKNLVYNKSFLV